MKLKLSQERNKLQKQHHGAPKIKELHQKNKKLVEDNKADGLSFSEMLTIEEQQVNSGLQSKDYQTPKPKHEPILIDDGPIYNTQKMCMLNQQFTPTQTKRKKGSYTQYTATRN